MHKKSGNSFRLGTCLIICLVSMQSVAQNDEQLWLDYQLDHPFRNIYLWEVTASYQNLLSRGSRWTNYNITPTFEYYGVRKVDFTFSVPYAYTLQSDTLNSYELDPILEARYNFTQGQRVDARLALKYEHRFFHEVEANDWNNANRVRIKGEIYVSITQPNLFTDKLLYSFVDYEEFFVLDKQLDERYSNRHRLRFGLGYRLSYRDRFEICYTLQASRNEIGEAFNRTDNVIQLRYKMFLNFTPPRQTTP
jgi:hypothetical protein